MWPNHSMELSATDGSLEDMSGPGNWMHLRSEAS